MKPIDSLGPGTMVLISMLLTLLLTCGGVKLVELLMPSQQEDLASEMAEGTPIQDVAEAAAETTDLIDPWAMETVSENNDNDAGGPPGRRGSVSTPRPGDRFTVQFISDHPAVTRMEVWCHVGKGTGTDRVLIKNAGPGPCKVVGHRGTKRPLIVSAVLTSPRTYHCFKGGRRTCDWE
jgi:hypothetical protein